jgi:hypothetical protein
MFGNDEIGKKVKDVERKAASEKVTQGATSRGLGNIDSCFFSCHRYSILLLIIYIYTVEYSDDFSFLYTINLY